MVERHDLKAGQRFRCELQMLVRVTQRTHDGVDVDRPGVSGRERLLECAGRVK